MSAKVTITVELNGGSNVSKTSTVTLDEVREIHTGPAWFDAMNVEDAITEAGRAFVVKVGKLNGDVREQEPNAAGIRGHHRTLTAS